MANQGAVSLDTVMLNIESNAGHATSNIDKLAISLGNLKTAINGIRPSNLKNLATYIDNLKTSSEGLNEALDNLSSLTKLTDLSKSLSGIQSPKGLKDMVNNIAKLPDVMGKIDTNTLENVGRVSSELANKLQPLADAMEKVANGYTAISTLARNYNVSIKSLIPPTEKQISLNQRLANTWNTMRKTLAFIGKNTGKFFTMGSRAISTLEKPLTKATSKIKQMGFALLSVRSAFTFARKAAGEYLALDNELQKSFTNTWRAMGAQLAPALEYVQYLFHQFVRVIYSVIYALTGIDLIARANEKAMKGWGKSAKDTLGNLQKFDDLNVVEFKDASGGDNQLIDMDKIDLSPIQKIIDWVRELKQTIEEALDTGKWKAVGEVFGKGISDGLAFLNSQFDIIYEKSQQFASSVSDFLNGLVSNLDFGELATTISNAVITFRNTISSVISGIDFKELGQKLTDFVKNLRLGEILSSQLDIFTATFGGISDAIETFDWKILSNKLSDAIIDVLDSFDKLINRINWNKLGEAIQTTIIHINWKKIIKSITKIIKSSFSGMGGFLDSLFGTHIFSDLAKDIDTMIDKIEKFASTTEKTLGENGTAGKIFKTLESIFKSINDLVFDITNQLLDWSVTPEFQDAIKFVDEIINDIFNAVAGVLNFAKDMYDKYLKDDIDEILGYIGDIIEDLKILYEKVLKPIGTAIWNFSKKVAEPVIKTIGDFISNTLKGLKGLCDFLVGTFTGDWKKAGKGAEDAIGGIYGAIKSLTDLLVDFGIWLTEQFINKGIIKPLNELIMKWNGSIGILGAKFGQNWTIKFISEVNLPSVAEIEEKMKYKKSLGTAGGREGGGFVPNGQFFYANENGVPEYIGRIGNRAAVANNDQIIQGIKQGVKEAIQESDSSQPIIINLGNETLYKKQQQYNKMQQNKYGTINL